MKLEVGKRYIRRDGSVTYPLVRCDLEGFPFGDVSGWFPVPYRSDGLCFGPERPSGNDLIKECPPVKYDIEKMTISVDDLELASNGDATHLHWAFAWANTPQGYTYWLDQFNGHIKLNTTELKEILKQYKDHIAMKDQPKLWKDMTSQERIEIFTAYENGEEVEVYDGDGWVCKGSNWLFCGPDAYRIKTAEPIEIPWDAIVDRFKWAAADECGIVNLYELEPRLGAKVWMCPAGEWKSASAIKHKRGTFHWTKSLIKRPE